MIASLQITPPQSSTAQPVNATSIVIDADVNYPSTMTVQIETDWDTYYNESDTNSACQLNSYATYTEDGTYLFRGKCTEITREVVGDTPTITMVFLDKMNELNHTLAAYKPGSTAYYVWSRATPVITLSRVQLYKLPYYEGGYRERWAPKYDSDAWLDTATTAATGQTFTLPVGGVTSGDTEIKATTANLGFPPSGLLSMTSGGTTSIVAYNGYTYNQGDGFWYFNNCDWVEDSGAGSAGLLGGTAANRAAGVTVYLLASKRIHFATRILVEGKEGANYEAIENTHYKPNWEDGSFIFSQSPLTLQLNAAAYDSMWISAGYYAEDDGSALTLQDVLIDVLQVGHASYAASMSLNFSSDLDSIYITRVVVDKPTIAMDFVKGLLNDLGLLRGVSTDAIYMAYSPSANSLKIRTVTQGTPTRYYDGERRRSVTVTMDEIASAVGALYQQGEAANLIDVERIWHTASDDAGGGSPPAGAVPALYQKRGNVWRGPATDGGNTTLYPDKWRCVQMPSVTAGTSAHDAVLNIITDNNDATGMALFWDTAAHCTSNDAFYAWFPGANAYTPDSYWIKKVTAVFELVGESEDYTDATKPGFIAHIKYYTDLVPDSTNPYSTAPTSAAGSQWLDARLTTIHKPGVYNTATLTVEADDLFVLGNAIGIEIESPMKDSNTPGSNWYGYKLLDLRVEGASVNFAAVALKASYAAGDSKTITAPLSYAKAVDTTIGDHWVKLIDVGAATREVALNFAWLQLLQLLALAQAKEYDIDSTTLDSQGVLELMETVQMSDGSIITVDSFTYTNAGGVRSLNLRGVDYNTPLFGAAV